MFTNVPDESLLPLKNPDLATRQTAKIQLQNGLNVLLVSDPAADQSAAAVAVQAGSWDDPEAYPGMAHFCEHMVFRGSEKYPDDDFFKPVSDYGGQANAYTAPDRTVYAFSCKHEGFLGNLDRFSRFFIDPLLKPEHVARELHAVDQEHAKNIEHDGWREYMIFKELGNSEHPNKKFSTGNAETLGKIPADALRLWHQENYAANRMHLFVCSSLGLEVLKQQVAELFGPVKANTQPLLSYGPITSETQRGHITYIKPVQHRRTVTLQWELPVELADDPTQSAELAAYALGRGHAESLQQLLKEKRLIDDMHVSADSVGGNRHRFFRMGLQLTAEGMKQLDTVICHCFEGIATLKNKPLPTFLFDEKNALSALKYQYAPRQDAFEVAESMASMLPDEPLETFPRQQLLAEKYDAKRVAKVWDVLRPETCCIAVVAPPSLTGVEPTEKEQWMQAEYTVRPIPKEWSARWTAAGPQSRVSVGTKNPFVPSKLETVGPLKTTVPTLLSSTPFGKAYYVRVPEFAAPDATIHVHISSPRLGGAKGAVLGALYLDHLTDLLNPTLIAAETAGLSARFQIERLKLHLEISGFSEKAPLLLQQVLEQMPKNPPTAEQFAVYVERHEKAFLNQQKELPVMQAKRLLDSVLMSERFTPGEMLEALRTTTHEAFLKFHQSLFDQTYVEALFAGNLGIKDAQSAWVDVQHMFSKNAYAERALPQVLELPEGNGPFVMSHMTESQGNGAVLAVDQGVLTFERRAVQETLSGALKEAFFNELRTKQKTGYIARADIAEVEGRLFQLFLVQSNSHQPDDLLHRYELFLEEFLETAETQIPKDRFEKLRDACVHSLQTRFRNVREKAALWNLLAFEKGADFGYIEKRVEALKGLSYERFLEVSREMLSRNNRKRLAVLYEGRLKAPFAYEAVEAQKLVEKSKYSVKAQIVQ